VNTAEPFVKAVIQRHDALKSDRGNWETQWQAIAELVRPMQADFTLTRTPGERRGLEIFDSTPGLAVENLSAGLWGMLTNSANQWMSLAHPEEAINEDYEVRSWLDDVTGRMLNAFAGNGQAFYARTLDMYASLATFGTALMFVDEVQPGRLRFSHRPLTECCIAESEEEQVDSVFRRFALTARQVVQRGKVQASWKVPKKIADCVEAHPEQKFSFLHAVFPNTDQIPGRRDVRGKAWTSVHICLDTFDEVQRGGYDEFPYMVPRWSTASRGLYGDSPAQLALADIKTLNVMSKTFLVAAQKAADPPLIAGDENDIGPVRVRPGGIIYGAVNADGRAMVQTLQSGGNFALTDEMLEQKRQAVREAFYASLLLMVQRPNATATEVLARQEEQLRLMGPHLGRLQSEFLDPLIGRVFSLLWRSQTLPPLPAALAQSPIVQAEYVSPLARAQKASEAQAVLRTLEGIMPMAQMDPDVLLEFKMGEMSRGLAEGNSLPVKYLRDKREVEQIKAQQAQARAQEAQQAKLLEAAKVAPGVADAAKSMGMAGAPA
jgi:hypothetical protein